MSDESEFLKTGNLFGQNSPEPSAKYPHCNQDILHAPGECFYCDKYPERQYVKYVLDGEFSNNEANGWSGNVAVKEGQTHTHMGITFKVNDEQEWVE